MLAVSTLSPASRDTDDVADSTVAPSVRVMSSPGFVDSVAVRTISSLAKTCSVTVIGLEAVIITGPAAATPAARSTTSPMVSAPVFAIHVPPVPPAPDWASMFETFVTMGSLAVPMLRSANR